MARLDWTRDELILALDVYFREPGARGSKSHPAVQELSALLNSLPIHPVDQRDSKFRNPNGVGMKLSNFLRFDPEYHGTGLPGGNQMEEAVWNEFAGDRTRLDRLASRIRQAADLIEMPTDPIPDVDELEAPEGTLLARLHKVRERSQKLVKGKKRQVLKSHGTLACEVCGFDFADRYGELGQGFSECHHRVPLADLEPGATTKLSDLAIVCANCHRMIHRANPWLTVEELRTILQRRQE